MQTVSPENILETKRKPPGCGKEPTSEHKTRKSQLHTTSTSQSFQFQPPPAQFVNGHNFDNVCGQKVSQSALQNSGMNFGSKFTQNHTRSTGNLLNVVEAPRMKSSPQIRNVRVNIVSPAARYVQQTQRTAPCVISESPYLHIQPVEPSTDYRSFNGQKSLTPQFSVGNIKLESLSINQQVPQCSGLTNNVSGGSLCARNISAKVTTPEAKNKRKRYRPYRSPYLDLPNQEDAEVESPLPETKKLKLEDGEF